MILKINNKLLLLFFFSLNFEVWDPLNTGGNFSIAKLTGLLYAISLIPNLGHFIVIPKNLRGSIHTLLLFYLSIFTLNFININYYSSDLIFVSFLQNLILFLFVVNHDRINPGIIEKGFIAFFIGSIILVAFYLLGIGIETNVEGRVSIFGDNENIIGIRIVISSFILTHILLEFRKKLSLFVFILLPTLYIPFVFLILKTGSRLSFISLFLGMSLIFLLYQNKSFVIKSIIVLIGVFVLMSLYNLAIESDVLGTRLLKTKVDGNIGGRDEIWQDIIPLIQENWLFGVGRTGYVEYAKILFGVVKSPHNVIIEVLAYSGIVGLLLISTFVYKSFYASYLYYKKRNKIVPFILIIPITGIILSSQILTFKLGWVIFAYLATRIFYLNENSLRNR